MDKLYSKQSLILKAVICILLSPLYILLSSLLTIENGFLYIIISALPIGCIYTVPFWLSLINIRKYRMNRIGQYIVYDMVSCLFPGIIGILFTEIIYTVVNSTVEAAGVITLMFGMIFLLISGAFWLMYFLFSKIK